jgi:hypothetical protein
MNGLIDAPILKSTPPQRQRCHAQNVGQASRLSRQAGRLSYISPRNGLRDSYWRFLTIAEGRGSIGPPIAEPRPGSWLLVFLLSLLTGCGAPAPDDGASPDVTTQGSIEVTAKIIDIAGEFPSNDLYDYAYVMKYEILETHRGEAAGTLFVGQYNPLKKRAEAADKRSGKIGGNVTRFRVGDIHRLALEPNIDEYCMAGIVNKYADIEPAETTLYWALWTNRVIQ